MDQPTSIRRRLPRPRSDFGLAVSVDGVDSGLDTVDGRSIFLYLENSLVVGRPEATIGSGAPGLGAGQVAVVLAVNTGSGNFSVNQYIAIKHPNRGGSRRVRRTADPRRRHSVRPRVGSDGDGDIHAH